MLQIKNQFRVLKQFLMGFVAFGGHFLDEPGPRSVCQPAKSSVLARCIQGEVL
jgi:hypothetical protein